MSEIKYAGEVELQKLVLISSSGTAIDLTELVININIYESLFSHAISGSILIGDTNNLAVNLPIIGQEYLMVKLNTPSLEGDKESIDFTENVFVIYKIKQREADGNMQVLELQFTTPEMLKNNRVRVSKSYTETIDNIAEDILTNTKYIDSKKDLFIEPTVGIRRMVIPNLHPYHALKNMATESISSEYNSPHYLFYENTRGIHFRSLQSLYAQNVTGQYHSGSQASDEDYDNYTNSGDSGALMQSIKRIINFSMGTNNDTLMNIVGGMLGSTIISHDIYNKSYSKNTFGYFDNFKDHERISENPTYNDNPIDEDENIIGDFPDARIHLHSIPSDNKDTQHYATNTSSYSYASNRLSDTLLSRQSRLAELRSGIGLTMEINGNTTIAAGDLIDVQLPIAGIDHDDDKVDKYYSGTYLITNLRHVFVPRQRTHNIVLSLAKDSIPEILPKKSDAIQPQPMHRGTITKSFY
jgi:hypothetical protein